MDCSEAQRLLDQGVTPGPHPAQRAGLGFHLAGCAPCRAYAADRQAILLTRLMDRRLWELPPQGAATREPTASVRNAAPDSAGQARPIVAPPLQPRPPRRGADVGRWLWYAGLGILTGLGLMLVLAIGTVTLSLVNIHRNLQAMIATPEPALAADIPTLPPTVAASPSPLPSQTAASHLPTQTPPPMVAHPALGSEEPVLHTGSGVTPELPTPVPTPMAGSAATILLLGSDRRPGEREPSRTDAIIVARIEPERRRVALLSLPRDLIVGVPGYGQTRINAANTIGFRDRVPGGGPELARHTVSALLGIPIDYYVYIDFEGFIAAIDAVGGVTVDVPRELYDSKFPTMDYGYTVAHFLSGPQLMDGATALMYSRIRHPDSDFARMRRQQAIVVGAFAGLQEQNLFETVHRVEVTTTALREYVRTNIPEQRMVALAWFLRDLPPASVERYVLDQQMVTFGVGADRWAEVARPGAIATVAGRLLGQR